MAASVLRRNARVMPLSADHMPKSLELPLEGSSRRTGVASTSQQFASAQTEQDLTEYICQGKLLEACGISRADVAGAADAWRADGAFVAANLGFDAANLNASQKERIYQYYLPIFYWLLRQVEGKRASYAAAGAPGRPLVLGISAPQGCGKTTVVEQLEKLLARAGKRVAAVSIDDFYLRNADQRALAEAHADNRLLQCRGNAGTHDLALGADTLARLVNLGPDEQTLVPRYDKSAFGGAGDRADEASWPRVTGPLDVVLFEGWMLGFNAVGEAAAAAVEDCVPLVDTTLREYKGAWDSFVDSWLVIKVEDPRWVFKWRLQAEEAMRASGKAGMSNAQIEDFVNRYMPAYKTYLPGLYKDGPTTARDGHLLMVEVDANRSPAAAMSR